MFKILKDSAYWLKDRLTGKNNDGPRDREEATIHVLVERMLQLKDNSYIVRTKALYYIAELITQNEELATSGLLDELTSLLSDNYYIVKCNTVYALIAFVKQKPEFVSKVFNLIQPLLQEQMLEEQEPDFVSKFFNLVVPKQVDKWYLKVMLLSAISQFITQNKELATLEVLHQILPLLESENGIVKAEAVGAVTILMEQNNELRTPKALAKLEGAAQSIYISGKQVSIDAFRKARDDFSNAWLIDSLEKSLLKVIDNLDDTKYIDNLGDTLYLIYT